MSKFVFFCIPAHGHTNPTLEVVRELINRGHEVRYYSYEMMRQKIESTGATFVSCDEYDAQQRLTPEDTVRLGSDLAFSTKILVDTTLALDNMVRRDVEAQRPDCIVADSMAVWGKAAAMKFGIPFVSSTTTFAFNEHSSRVMKQSFIELLRMLLAMPKINHELKRLRQRGYPVNTILDIIANDPNTHTIVYTSRKFQPCADTFPDCYAFVGPSIRPPQHTFEKGCEKLIYLSMGTVNNDMLYFYKECICAFGKSKHSFVLSVGENIDTGSFGKLPENVRVYQSVDQIAVLQQADAFVTHCGMNSVSESLYFGVPMVLLPQTAEQKGVAARTLALGAGIQPDKMDAIQILAAVEQLLNDLSYRGNATEIGADFRSCAGAAGAADKLEQVANA